MIQREYEMQQQEKQTVPQSVIYKVRDIMFLKKKSNIYELENNSAAQNCEN